MNGAAHRSSDSPRLGGDGAAEAPSRPTLALVWRVGRLLCASEAATIEEVLSPVPCWAAPLVPPWVRGLFSYRGELAAMVDVAALLGIEATEDRMSNRVLVMRLDPHGSTTGAAERGARLLGLWVHSVLDLASVDFRSAAAHPGFANDQARFLGPIGQTPWGLAQLVTPRELFTEEQWAVVSARLREGGA
ncbi:MAG: chemotaxis protein CheW [Phycisphaerales bacterium]